MKRPCLNVKLIRVQLERLRVTSHTLPLCYSRALNLRASARKNYATLEIHLKARFSRQEWCWSTIGFRPRAQKFRTNCSYQNNFRWKFICASRIFSDFFRKCTQNRPSGRKRFVMKEVSLMHDSSISGTCCGWCCYIILNIIMLEKRRRRFTFKKWAFSSASLLLILK